MGDTPPPVRVIADPGIPQDRIYVIRQPAGVVVEDFRIEPADGRHVVAVSLGGVEPDPPFSVREMDGAVIDPLVTALLSDHADPTRLAEAARLSAVLAAARAVITNRAGETGREATMTYRVLALVDALAAADGAL